MSTTWDSYEDEIHGDSWSGGFSEHCEYMKCFLQHHNAWRLSRTFPMEKMLPYDVRHGLVEAGGSSEIISEADWCLLLPLRKITRKLIITN